MRNFDEKHRRKSIRLVNYDYSQNGGYFVTICVKNRQCLLGNIENGKMKKSELGEIVDKYWNEIPEHFPDVKLRKFVIMPNHIHGIIIIDKPVGVQNEKNVGVQNLEPLQNRNTEPLENKYQKIIPRSLGSIIRGFKIGVTKHLKTIGFADSLWQRNFYENIIRNQKSFEMFSEYITYNPEKWNDDMFFVSF